jgi:hypothetical protein
MPDEKRETACMIDMRVRKHDGINRLYRYRELQVLRVTFAASSLKQTAVKNYRLTRNTKDVTRTSNLPRGADELNFHNSLERR